MNAWDVLGFVFGSFLGAGGTLLLLILLRRYVRRLIDSSWQWSIAYQMDVINCRLDRTNDPPSALVAPVAKDETPPP